MDVWPIGGSFAVLGERGSPFNKLIGLGFGEPIDATALEVIERAHASRHARLQVELSTLANTDVGRLLTERGYRLIGFENVLARRLADVHETSGGAIEIGAVSAADSNVWIRTVTDAFQQPDVFDGPESHESFDRATLERTYRYFTAVPGTSRLLARLDGVVAGGASLYLREGIAMLCGAATLPASLSGNNRPRSMATICRSPRGVPRAGGGVPGGRAGSRMTYRVIVVRALTSMPR